jgi:hypothetical protein
MHKDFGFGGVPIRLIFRKSAGKAADRSKLLYSKRRRQNSMSKPVGKYAETQFDKYLRKTSQHNSRLRRLKLRKKK